MQTIGSRREKIRPQSASPESLLAFQACRLAWSRAEPSLCHLCDQILRSESSSDLDLELLQKCCTTFFTFLNNYVQRVDAREFMKDFQAALRGMSETITASAAWSKVQPTVRRLAPDVSARRLAMLAALFMAQCYEIGEIATPHILAQDVATPCWVFGQRAMHYLMEVPSSTDIRPGSDLTICLPVTRAYQKDDHGLVHALRSLPVFRRSRREFNIEIPLSARFEYSGDVSCKTTTKMIMGSTLYWIACMDRSEHSPFSGEMVRRRFLWDLSKQMRDGDMEIVLVIALRFVSDLFGSTANRVRQLMKQVPSLCRLAFYARTLTNSDSLYDLSIVLHNEIP